ncbi:MAG: MATE family efflux transporter [Mogibacterium sp.]|nr:MATE family efflux transporter [Mogibacterium sp.]
MAKNDVTRTEKIRLVIGMSLPAILAQLTTIAMEYIDAGMVGSLGAGATAAIGLVSSSIWLIGGSCIGLSAGFYVQVAHLIGARREREAESVLRQGLKAAVLLGVLICIAGVLISGSLPGWLGGDEAIRADASAYFRIYSLSVPFVLIRQMSCGMMQSTGDMKTPSILSALICLLDVVLNFFMIFPTRMMNLAGMRIMIPGAGMQVKGAAIATALSDVIIAMAALYLISYRNNKISLRNRGSWSWDKKTVLTAAKIGIPLSCDQIFMCSAYVAGTLIVARLGTVPVAANSLAITAESLCYMPGYGIGAAATAIIGQSIGAQRYDLTRSFARVSVALGMIMMGIMGALMYLCAPHVFSLLTSSAEVAVLGTAVLRIELFAEPLYGASICCAGVFRGAGDTLTPSVMNLLSMWCVRIIPAIFLVPVMGLRGYWTAMAVELCFRGIIFLIRMSRGKWIREL